MMSSLACHLAGLEMSNPRKTALFAYLMRYRLLDIALWMQGEATRKLEWVPGDGLDLESSTKLVSDLRLPANTYSSVRQSLSQLDNWPAFFNSRYKAFNRGLQSMAVKKVTSTGPSSMRELYSQIWVHESNTQMHGIAVNFLTSAFYLRYLLKVRCYVLGYPYSST
jgi:hypothetical protein